MTFHRFISPLRYALIVLLLAVVSMLLLAMLNPAHGALLEVQTAEESMEVPRGFGLRAGFMASDNINRVPEDGEDELFAVIELVSNWEFEGARSQAIVAGNLAFRHYTQGEFDDEFRGNLFMGANYDIVPRNISWQITNHYANAPINPLTPGGPENTQYYNVLETGPRFVVEPGDRHEFEISAARADVQAEVSEIDHERDTLLGRWSYLLSETSDFSVNAVTQEVQFDEGVEDDDFDKDEIYLGYDRRGRTTNLSLAAGRASTDLEEGESRDTDVGWIRMSTRRTSESRIFLNLARRAGDTSTMLNRELLRPSSIWRLIAVGDPYIAEQAFVSYSRGVRGRQWSAVASLQQLDYFVSPFDQKQRGLRLNTEMTLARNLLLALSAGHVKIDYDDRERIDRLGEVGAELDYRIDRNWSLVTGARHVDADSTDPDNRFKELFLTFFINYTPGGREPLGSAL